jgi:hypothetical protein
LPKGDLVKSIRLGEKEVLLKDEIIKKENEKEKGIMIVMIKKRRKKNTKTTKQ